MGKLQEYVWYAPFAVRNARLFPMINFAEELLGTGRGGARLGAARLGATQRSAGVSG